MPSTVVTSSRASSPWGDLRPSNRSRRSLSDKSIKTPRASACLTVKPEACRSKNFSMKRSFSRRPRRQRQRSLLRPRSSSRTSAAWGSRVVIRRIPARSASPRAPGERPFDKLRTVHRARPPWGRTRSGAGGQTDLITIISLILPMALVGFRPLGQTSTQFMMVWQRNRRYGSSRLSRRSAVPWSRLSAMKR
jgi:hypothetical protein